MRIPPKTLHRERKIEVKRFLIQEEEKKIMFVDGIKDASKSIKI